MNFVNVVIDTDALDQPDTVEGVVLRFQGEPIDDLTAHRMESAVNAWLLWHNPYDLRRCVVLQVPSIPAMHVADFPETQEQYDVLHEELLIDRYASDYGYLAEQLRKRFPHFKPWKKNDELD